MRFPFDSTSHLVIVTAQILGPAKEGEADLIVDTGAAWSVLSQRLLRELGYDPAAADERRVIITAKGSVSVPALRVQRFRALGKERLNFPVVGHDLPASLQVEGLLGLDFIRRYRLVVDFRGGFISLRP